MKDSNDNHINDFWGVAYGGIFSSRHRDGSNKPEYHGNYSDKNNKWYPWDNWYSSPDFWFKWISILILILILFGIGTCVYRKHWHKPAKGSGYWAYDCVEYVLRSEYDKDPSKYPIIKTDSADQ